MTTTTVNRTCEACGADLGLLARPDQRYCKGSACRVRAHRARTREQHKSPVGEWLAQSSAVSPELAKAVEEAIAEPRLVALVAKAASSNWRAAAWLLERRYREHWSPQRVEKDALPPIADDD